MKNKKVLFYIVMILIYCISFTPRDIYANGTVNEMYIDSQKKSSPLDLINEFRSVSKVPDLQNNQKLQDTAKNHNQYMIENKVFSHQQEKGKKYFKGVYPLDRAAYFGYEYPFVIEFIQENTATDMEAAKKLIDNPYTRLSILNPNYIHIGIDGQDGTYTFELGGKKASKECTVIYPAEDQVMVPTEWNNAYEIDPFRKSKEKRIITGYPITFSYFSNQDITSFKVNIEKVSLINKHTQESLPVIINTPDNDEYLVQSLLMIPLTDFEKNTEYEANVEVNVTFKDGSKKDISKTWTFSTSEEQQKINQVQDLEDHWGKEEIKYLLNNDIASLKQDQFYMPDQHITRQEFTRMAVKAMGVPVQKMENKIFRDVDLNSPYADYIFTAYKNQIVSGYTRTTFGPNEEITREQIITILMRMYNQMLNKNYKSIDVSLSRSFKDIEQTSSWARSAVLAAKELSIIQGREDKKFYPKEETTRAEAAIMVYRYIKYVETQGDSK